MNISNVLLSIIYLSIHHLFSKLGTDPWKISIAI